MIKLAIKDFKLFFSDKRGMFLTFLLPIILISLFGFIFGVRDKHVSRPQTLIVADEDKTAASKNIIAQLDSLPELEIAQTTTDSARSKIRKGDEDAVLVFHKGFGDSINTGSKPPLELQYDGARQMELGLLQSALIANLMQMMGTASIEKDAITKFDEQNPFMDTSMRRQIHQQMSENIASTNKNPNQDESVIKMTAIVSEAENSPMLVQVVAGNSIMMLLFSVVAIGASLLEEKQEGTLKKLLLSPIHPNSILFGKMLYTNLICMLQLSIMFLYAWLLFGLSVPQNIPGLLIMIIATSFACSSFGVLLASFSKSKAQVQGFSTLIVLTMSAIGGSMIPSFIMPALLQKVAHFTVNYWGIQGFYDIFWRKLSITDPSFLSKIGVLLGIGFTLNIIALSMFKKNILKIA